MNPRHLQMINELVDQFISILNPFVYKIDPSYYPAGSKILAIDPSERIPMLLAIIQEMNTIDKDSFAYYTEYYHFLHLFWNLFNDILNMELKWNHDNLVLFIKEFSGCVYNTGFYLGGIHRNPFPALFNHLKKYISNNELTPELRQALLELKQSEKLKQDIKPIRKIHDKINGILFGNSFHTIEPKDKWGKAVLADLEIMTPWERSQWDRLLAHFSMAQGSKPTKKWLRKAVELLPPLEPSQFREKLKYWKGFLQIGKDKDQQLKEPNATILKGMIWFCQNFEDPEIIRLVSEYAVSCLKKTQGWGAICLGAGNACITVLGAMSHQEAVIQLIKLKRGVKYSVPRKLIEKNLGFAAEKQGMTVDDLEEIALPSYGFDSHGVRREKFGNVNLEIRISGMDLLWKWILSSGKTQTGIPKDVKTGFANELTSLKKEMKEVEKILPTQRDRIDRLMMGDRTWTFGEWRKRYLDHPIVSDMSRRIIWNYETSGIRKSGIWEKGRIVDSRGLSIELTDNTTVTLWHPIDAKTGEVKAWQDWILSHRITQPFRQVFREIYILSEEERKCIDHSNRFAAHILKQHQLAALCRAFGWKYQLIGQFDSYFCPRLEIPQHNMMVELEMQTPDPEGTASYGGILLYVFTDKVYFLYQNGQRIPLERIPGKIFSEAMRSVDLLVSVSSIGRDPNWGMEGDSLIYKDYWTSCGSLDLLPSEETRAVILEWMIPQLEITDRCRVQGNYLHVRGDLRNYKIHIGCGRVMLEPENRHLLIEPDSKTLKRICDHLYIPIEGDSHLYLIIAKAFLLSKDKDIDDPNILSQILKE